MADLTATRITVAIPTYNGARHLPEALGSVLAQGDELFDLVISDDRSEDETLDLVRSLAADRARVSVNSERLGLAGNWNRCVELASTPWVAVFHQDDVMGAGHLASHHAVLSGTRNFGGLRKDRGELGLVCSRADAVDANGHRLPPAIVEPGSLDRLPSDRLFPPGELLPALTLGNPIRCSAVTLSRKVHRSLGGFDPSYRYVLDWDFWLRVAFGFAVAWLAAPTVSFRWHAANESHRFKTDTRDLDEQSRLLNWVQTELSPGFPSLRSLRRPARRRLARAYVGRAYEATTSGDRRLEIRCLRAAASLAPGVVAGLALEPRLLGRLVLGRKA